jgi:hypothetical protein
MKIIHSAAIRILFDDQRGIPMLAPRKKNASPGIRALAP